MNQTKESNRNLRRDTFLKLAYTKANKDLMGMHLAAQQSEMLKVKSKKAK